MKLSKSEKKRIRMEQNKEWQLLYKSKGVEKDLNPRYSLYYHLQLPELNEEWDQLVEIMKKGLPATFRISERCNFFVKKALSKRLEQHYRSLRGKFVQMKGEAVVGNLLDSISWAPSTYQMTVDNFTISHEVSLREFSNFLSREVDLGHIVRQELVSMIPALLLDVHHSHTILDCCAAPGSKTEQLLSLMKHSARQEGFSSELPIQGTVVANDADSKRIQTLIDRFHKLNSPNILFTCMNAESFASIFSTNDNRIESFDRILCDVPCTGDGTFRKCPYLWRLFRPRSGLQIHEVQLNIVTEAVKLLKPGGKLVYSTCSLNPIEDEAVVTALLRHYDGYLKLVDSKVDEKLPGLKYRKGINTWHTDIDSFLVGETDPIERKTSQDRLPTLGSTIVPPQNESEIKKFNLDKSIRIVPHDQNTGGFFIAVFEKIQSTESFTSNSFSKNNNSLATKTKNFFDDLAEPTKANQDIDSLQITKKQKKSKDSDKSTSGEKLMKELGYNPKQSEAKSDQFTSLKALVFDEVVDPRSILDDQAASKTLLHTLYSYLPLIATSDDEEEIQKKSLCLISLKTVSEDEYKLVLVSSHTYRAIKRWNISIPLIHGGITLDLSSNASLYSYHAMSMLSKNLLPIERGTFNLSNNDFLNIFQQTMRALKERPSFSFESTDKACPIIMSLNKDSDCHLHVPLSATAALDRNNSPKFYNLAISKEFLDDIFSFFKSEPQVVIYRRTIVFQTLFKDTKLESKGNTSVNLTSDNSKRRLSKAEKKKLKSSNIQSNSTSNTAIISSEEQEDETEFGSENFPVAFFLSVKESKFAYEESNTDPTILSLLFEVATPSDICESYLTILS